MTFEDDITAAVDVLQTGGVILYPTDTIWGLGCDATNEQAVRKIYTLKQRAFEKSMIILLADEKDIFRFVAAPPPGIGEWLETCIRPTTVIYKGGIGFAQNLMAVDGSIGIRVTKDLFCRHLIRRFRKPVVSTSANISGEPSPSTFREISPVIINAVDYVVNHRQDDEQPAVASSVVSWENGMIRIIRP